MVNICPWLSVVGSVGREWNSSYCRGSWIRPHITVICWKLDWWQHVTTKLHFLSGFFSSYRKSLLVHLSKLHFFIKQTQDSQHLDSYKDTYRKLLKLVCLNLNQSSFLTCINLFTQSTLDFPWMSQNFHPKSFSFLGSITFYSNVSINLSTFFWVPRFFW